MEAKRVFLSHTSELAGYPTEVSFLAAAKDAISRARCVIEEMDYFTAGGPVSDACTKEVRLCDIYVGVFGFKYGTRVKDQPEMSYTELEYETARAAGMPCLVFLLHMDAEVPARLVVDTGFAQRQEALRELALKSGEKVDSFRTADELRWKLVEALDDLKKREQLEPGFRNAPTPPPNAVARPPVTDHVQQLLREARNAGGVITLHGPPGTGKSTLAAWICEQDQVQAWFEGILWVPLGPRRTDDDLLKLIGEQCERLSAERVLLTGLRFAADRFGKLLGDRRLLIVLDDVCRKRDIEPFMRGGRNCTWLITARNVAHAPEHSHQVLIEAMEDAEGQGLLRFGLRPDAAEEMLFARLVSRAANWALLLGLMNGALRELLLSRGSLAEALSWVDQRLDDSKLADRVDIHRRADREAAVGVVVDLALEAVRLSYGAPTVDRYAELAIFPDDSDIGVTVLKRFWRRTGGLDDTTIHASLREMSRMGLTQRYDQERGTVKLHPEFRGYLRRAFATRMTLTHGALLDAYRPSLAHGWWSLPRNERYMWTNLSYHLREAGRADELRQTVIDPRFLVAKASQLGPAAVEADLREAVEIIRGDPLLVELLRLFRQGGHLLTGCHDSNQLAATLRVRMTHVDELRELLPALDEMLGRLLLVPAWPLPDHPAPGLELAMSHPSDSEPLNDVAWDRPGGRVASAGANGILRIWDVHLRKTMHDWDAHACEANAVDWASVDERLASGGADGTVCLWDAELGDRLARCIGHKGPVNAVAWSPSGELVASGGADGTIRIWNGSSTSGRCTAEWQAHDSEINVITWDAAGHRLASGGADGVVRVWDSASSAPLAVCHGHGGPVKTAAFDPTGRLLASGGADATVRVWEASTGAPVAIIPQDDIVNAVSFDVSGRRLAAGGEDNLIRVWDVDSHALLSTLPEHAGPVNSLVFDRSGARVVSAGADGAVCIWTTESNVVTRPEHTGYVTAVAFHSSSLWAASGGNDGRLRLWDAASGASLTEVDAHSPGWVNSVAIQPDGNRIVTGGFDQIVRVWEWGSSLRPVVTLSGPVDAVNCVAITSSGTCVAACAGRDVWIWALDDLRAVRSRRLEDIHSGIIRATALDYSGEWVVSGGDDGIVRLSNMATGKQRHLARHRGRVNSVAFSHADDSVVSAGEDGSVRIWPTDGDHEEALLDIGSEPIACATLDHQDRWIIAAARDGTIGAWDRRTQEPLATVKMGGPLFSCCVEPGGGLLVGGARGLYLFRLEHDRLTRKIG